MWVPRIKLRSSSGLAAKYLYPLSHLTSPAPALLIILRLQKKLREKDGSWLFPVTRWVCIWFVCSSLHLGPSLMCRVTVQVSLVASRRVLFQQAQQGLNRPEHSRVKMSAFVLRLGRENPSEENGFHGQCAVRKLPLPLGCEGIAPTGECCPLTVPVTEPWPY